MKQIIGIGFLLLSKNNILTVEELKSKPALHKKAGMISFPLETFDSEKDKNFFDTINRLLEEELGVEKEEVFIQGICPKAFNIIPNRNDIVTHYGTGLFLGNPNRVFIPKDTDIRVAGWITPEQLLKNANIRLEVHPILTHFQESKY